MSWRRVAVVLLVVGAILPASAARAGGIEIGPFGGVQFPGTFFSTLYSRNVPMGIGFDWGGTADIEIADGWAVELLYSHQSTELSANGVPAFPLKIQRWMAGVQESKGVGDKATCNGAFLLGATRFAPKLEGFGSGVAFTLALGLGLELPVGKRVALRTDARGYLVTTAVSGGAICSGGCIFSYSGTGAFQGDLTFGVVIGFK